MFGYNDTPKAEWRPAAASTPGTAAGFEIAASGTPSHPALASGSLLAESRRARFTSGTSANSVGGLRSTSTLAWLGSSAHAGGICFTARFSLTTNVSQGRAFIGLTGLSTDACAAEPSAANDSIGLAFDSTDSSSGNWFLMSRDGTTTTRIDLGAAVSRSSSDVFLLVLRAPPNASQVGATVINLTQGIVVFNTYVSSHLPTASTFLYAQAQVGIAGGGAATALDLLQLVIDDTDDGIFNVRQFGALGDGSTDDTASFQAAILASAPDDLPGATVYVPRGRYRFASNLHVTRQVLLTGVAGGFDDTASVLQFDAGFGVIVDSVDSFPPQWTASTAMTLASRVQPIPTILMPSGVPSAPTFEYRPVSIGSAPHQTSSSEPTWPTTFGVTVSDGDITWTPYPIGAGYFTIIQNLRIESTLVTLSDWQPSTAYALHDLVRRTDDNRYFHEAVQAGTSGSAEPTWLERLYAAAPLDTTTDGSVTWLTRVHCGILCLSRTKIRECFVHNFTSAGIMMYGVAYDSLSNTNGSHISECRIVGCGVGVYVFSNDANALLIEGCDLESIGAGQPGTGGHGFVDASFLGSTYLACQTAICSGRPYWTPPGGPGFSSFLGCYSEAATIPSDVTGLVLGGDHGAGFEDTSDITGYLSLNANWRRLWVKDYTHPKKAELRVDLQGLGGDHGFNAFASDDDFFSATLADRYEATSDPAGWLIRGLAGTTHRRITGVSLSKAQEGPGHFRIFQGEVRGDTLPYYVGYESKTDTLVRAGEQGVGGHYKVADRFELSTTHPVTMSEMIVDEGWQAPMAWQPSAATVTYDAYVDGNPSSMVHPTTPNGFAYVATKIGTTGGSEPAWPTTALPGGVVPYAWVASMKRRVGDYGAPSTRNGHYYRVTAVGSPDANGYGAAGSSAPTWLSGSGATVTDGALTWTEQGSDAGTYVSDGTTEWQCVGPEPTVVATGTMEGVIEAPLVANSGRNLTIAECAFGTVKVTGTITAARGIFYLTLPADDAHAYTRCIRNLTTGGFPITVSISGGAGSVTIANGMTAIVGVDTGGVFRKTPDV